MKKSIKKFLWGALDIAVIIGVVVLIRTFVISPVSVLGESMKSTLENGDLILVDKLSYRLSSPKRGDIIVFYPPIEKYTRQTGLLCLGYKALAVIKGEKTADACRVRELFVKRVIGLPGDTVEIFNGDVFVTPSGGQKQKVRDDFLDTPNQHQTCIPAPTCIGGNMSRHFFFSVPENAVFAIGDNRRGSYDSREWREHGQAVPFVPFKNILGKVRVVFWPLGDFHLFSSKPLLETAQKNP